MLEGRQVVLFSVVYVVLIRLVCRSSRWRACLEVGEVGFSTSFSVSGNVKEVDLPR